MEKNSDFRNEPYVHRKLILTMAPKKFIGEIIICSTHYAGTTRYAKKKKKK